MTEPLSISALQKVLSNIEEAVLFVYQHGKIIKGNNAAVSLLGYEKLNNEDINDYLDFDRLKTKEKVNTLMELKNKMGQLIEVRSIRINTNTYCLFIQNVSLRGETPLINNHLKELLETSKEGLVMYTDDIVVDSDTAFAKMFGYDQSELMNMKTTDLFDTKIQGAHCERMNDSEVLSIKLLGIHKDTNFFHIQLIQHTYDYDGNQLYISRVRDISEIVAHEKQLEYMTFYDELTNLPNEHFFFKKVEELISEVANTNQQFAIYYVDFNYFKQLNDTLSYNFGNKLIKACGNELQSFLQKNIFLARIEGNKYLILHREIKGEQEATKFAQQIISTFNKPIEIEEYEVNLSISIGISIYPQSGRLAKDLIRHAHSAMDVIKDDNRRRYHLFDKSISNRFNMMFTMESDLRKALNNNQFQLYYQPQKSFSSNKVVGVEALLRWNHPTKGNIPPMDFISLAEKTGLIIPIGDWVLEEACRQNKKWQERGYDPIVISVNMSAKQFHQHNIVEKVKNALYKTGLDPIYLELEITESMAMTNEKYILKTMQSLQELGVVVSIDDFGTGYSSLKYLSLFPVNKLKIDKMFMDTNQRQNQAIVKSIINMSHSLNMEVIAEGVETIEQVLFLQREKCDQMQGYYFSKPVEAKKFVRFLRNSS